jgi:hypothetical protein
MFASLIITRMTGHNGENVMRRVYGIAAIAAAIAILAATGGADAQLYPARPIKIVVPATISSRATSPTR